MTKWPKKLDLIFVVSFFWKKSHCKFKENKIDALPTEVMNEKFKQNFYSFSIQIHL